MFPNGNPCPAGISPSHFTTTPQLPTGGYVNYQYLCKGHQILSHTCHKQPPICRPLGSMPAATPYKGRDHDQPRPADDGAALRGATLAFGAKPNLKPKPAVKNYSGNNGALAAAMKVGTHLQPPHPTRRNSDSRIAANLAASRPSSLSPMNTGQRSLLSPAGHSSLNSELSPDLPRSSSISSTASREIGPAPAEVKIVRKKKKTPVAEQAQRQRPVSSGSHNHALDTTPIASTNKLISIFEDKSPPTGTLEKAVPERQKEQSNDKDAGLDRPAAVLNGQEKSRKSFQGLKSTPRSPKPKPIAYRIPPASQKLQRRASVRARPGDSAGYDNAQNESYSSSDDSFVSASDFKENETQSPPVLSPKPIPPKPIPPAPRGTKKEFLTVNRTRRVSDMEYHGAFVPHLTGDSMADAVTAGSLASSRAASPSRAPPIPPKPAKHSLFHQHRLQDSRTPSPAAKGGFRKTMRNPPKEIDEYDEQMERRGRKRLLHKHPNKHAEGDRKRWRDEITERERKRYEAVWASNKGLFLDTLTAVFVNTRREATKTTPESTIRTQIDQAEMVSNIAVRDIWKRSRLGSDVLEEVWDLVNRTQYGALTREEFVVGLWLIDQRLRGRKLPIKVSDSVWWSASRVRVIPPKKRR